MPRSSVYVPGLSLRVGGLWLALFALSAASTDCGLDAQGSQFAQGAAGTSGTVGSGGGGGGSVSCAPGATEVCYSGPAGSENVGVCVAGMRTCDQAGTGWGPCVGEVAPAPETCSTPTDDDCDGLVNEDGEGCGCTANVDTKPCYSGAPGTEGKGVCKAGIQTCKADGSGYGQCNGEVLPDVEDCKTKDIDEDCNGSSAEYCAGDTHWSKRAGDPNADVGAAIAADADGNVIVAGTFEGMINLGGPMLQSAGGSDLFVAKYDSNGSYIWSKRFGDAMDDVVFSMAVDAKKNIVLVGYYVGAIDFGGGALQVAQNGDGFVAKLSPDGQQVWAKRLGGAGTELGVDVDIGPSDDVFVAGLFSGVANFGAGALTSAGGGDYFLVKAAAADGATQWSKRFGDAAEQSLCYVAVDAQGSSILTGALTGAVNFGGSTLTAQGSDVFVAKFAPDGSHLMSTKFGDASDQSVGDVDVDSAGRILIAGSYQGTIDFGGGPLTAAGGADAFVARLNPDLSHSFSMSFGDASGSAQNALEIAAGLGDSVLVSGQFTNAIDFGGSNILTGGTTSLYAVKLDATGSVEWSRAFLGGGAEPRGLEADPTGNVLISGVFVAGIDFGGGINNHISAGNTDAFFAKLEP